MTAASRVTCTAITNGEKPAVPSAILKYHNTELGRQVANDAMDVHGGKGIMLGPKNYLARGYEGVPIAITVEGANILTRNLIIFGQGAIRCHPFVRAEMDAARDPDREAGLAAFDRLLFKHLGYGLSNAARSLVMAVTLARFTEVPVRRADAPLLPAHQPLQRVVRADHGRRDVHARRRAQAPRADLGAARRHLELPVSRVDGAQALPGPRRAARGSAARRVVVPHAAVQDAGAVPRPAAQFPEPLGRRDLAVLHLPARPHVLGAVRRARPTDRRAHHQSRRRRASASRTASTRPSSPAISSACSSRRWRSRSR